MVSSSPHVFAFCSQHGYTVTNANITWRDYITLSLPSSPTSSQKDEEILPDRETACVTFRVTPPVVRSVVVIVALLKFTKESSQDLQPIYKGVKSKKPCANDTDIHSRWSTFEHCASYIIMGVCCAKETCRRQRKHAGGINEQLGTKNSLQSKPSIAKGQRPQKPQAGHETKSKLKLIEGSSSLSVLSVCLPH